MSHADYLMQRGRAAAFRVTHPADFEDTLIVDNQTGKPAKADERYAAGADMNELGHTVALWLCLVILAVFVPALALQFTWVDVLAWLTDAADAIARLL